jgi:hypothetical protein
MRQLIGPDDEVRSRRPFADRKGGRVRVCCLNVPGNNSKKLDGKQKRWVCRRIRRIGSAVELERGHRLAQRWPMSAAVTFA